VSTVLKLENVSKSFRDDHRGRHTVLSGVSLRVDAGEIVWLRGDSGSGKSTVLNIAGLLSTPDAGSVWVDGRDFSRAAPKVAARTRASRIGMVFQSSNLLPELTALENVLLASRGRPSRDQLLQELDRFGLTAVADRKAKKLSGGQQQRVAFCRAVFNRPSVLLADEPTSGLDPTNTELVLKALRTSAANGCGVLVASHDQIFEQVAHRELPMSEVLIEQA